MTLTVETLRKFLADLPGDMPVQIDFNTDYDGIRSDRSGMADEYPTVYKGRLVISADDRAKE